MAKDNHIKIETADDWKKAVNFIPKKDQIIIYDGIKEDDKYVQPPRIKIGDGIRPVEELPFEESLEVSYIAEQQLLILDL